MGLPECALKNGCWTIKCEAKYPLHILNLYRKVMMSKVGVYKLKVKYFETDDPFLINEFIQTRIK